MHSGERVYHRVAQVIAWGSAGAIGLMMAVAVIEVIGRKFFGFSIVGAVEFISSLLVVAASLAVSYTERLRGHVRVDFLVSRFGCNTQLALEAAIALLMLGLYFALVWQSWGFALDAWHVGLTYETSSVPVFPFRAVVSVGIFFFGVQILLRLVANMTRLLRISRD